MFKKILLIVIGIIFVSCEKENFEDTYDGYIEIVNDSHSLVTHLNVTESFNEIPLNGTRWEIISSSMMNPHGNMVYTIETEMYKLIPGFGHYGDSQDGHPILFKLIDNEWKYFKSFPNIKIEGIRNHRVIDDSTFIWAESSENLPISIQSGAPIARPSNAWLVKVIKDDVIFTKINDETNWFHDISYGDLDNDGLFDIVWNSNDVYFQNQDGSFRLERDVFPGTAGTVYFTVEIGDLFGDSQPEIVLAAYLDAEHTWQKNGFIVYQFNNQTRKMEEVLRKQNPLLQGDLGGSYTRILDINNDGFNDIIIGREGPGTVHTSTIEIWLGDGTPNLIPVDVIGNSDEFLLLGFELLDVNHDNFLDIIIKSGGGGSIRLGSRFEDGFKLNDLIWINDGSGKFDKYTKTELVGGENTTFEKFIPYMKNGNLSFFGSYVEPSDSENANVWTWDVEIINL